MLITKLCFQLIGAQYILLEPLDILFLEADRQVCHINLRDGNKLVAVKHLGYYKKKMLDQFGFLELSKSIVINTRHITKYSPRDRVVHLSSGQGLTVAKTRQEMLNKTFRKLHEDWADGIVPNPLVSEIEAPV